MFSLNAPVPGDVSRIAGDLRGQLLGFESIRDDHTLVVKRLGDPESFHALERRVRRALSGTPAMEARVSAVGVFEDPPRGSAPVVYLAVESPGLDRLHRRLVEEFGAVEGLEGEDYAMHVTLARGGDEETARRLADREVDPVTWTVSELQIYDATRSVPAARIALPA
jgi:2'-5' RNA ligase